MREQISDTRLERHPETGSVLIAFALLLTLLLAFAALATEGGRWYLVRAELSKSVDAAAIQGAKNISNPNVSPTTLAEEFCAENFENGHVGTPTSGTGTPTFHAEMVGTDRVKVSGDANAQTIFGQMVGFDQVPVSASGAAAMGQSEIMLILDRSGSMAGQPIADLKVAANSFLDFFVDSQSKDKMGLISFATAAKVDRPMGTNYVTAMKTAINAMAADGYTNAEDAIDQADGPQGFTNQTGVLPENRVQQFAIFFSDGRPNTIRWNFKYKNVNYDAVAHCDGNCDPGETKAMNHDLFRPDNGQNLMVGGVQVPSVKTGDGVFPNSKYGTNVVSTRWYALDSYPIAGYAPDAYNIPDAKLHDQMCFMASTLAIKHAQELKDAGVSVFVIALGTQLNQSFLEAIASSPEQVYVAPTSQDLQAMFVKLAQGIKLRLVQ